MKKTMVYLPDEVHEGLRRLAFEHKVSMAELVRRAIDAAYGETLEDIRDAELAMAEYEADPSSAVPLEDVMAELMPSVSRRRKSRRAASA